MVTHRHDPTNCGAYLAAAQLSPIIGAEAPSVKRICPQCGTAFEPNSGKHVFCVPNCQQRHTYHRFRILHLRTCAAPGCRRTFTVTDPAAPEGGKAKGPSLLLRRLPAGWLVGIACRASQLSPHACEGTG